MTKFTYRINERGNATVSLVAYYGAKEDGFKPSVEEHIAIPSMIDGIVVDEIAENGLSICEDTLSIYVPATITKIGNNAFARCINAVIYFESREFDYRKTMHNGDAPNTYFGIDSNNLFRDDKYDYLINNDHVALVHYNNWELRIKVPTSVIIYGKQLPVTEIKNSCFDTAFVCDTEEIVIPNGVSFDDEVILARCEMAKITHI